MHILDQEIESAASLIRHLRISIENPDGTAGGLIALAAREHPEERADCVETYRQYRRELQECVDHYQMLTGRAYAEPYDSAAWYVYVEADDHERKAIQAEQERQEQVDRECLGRRRRPVWELRIATDDQVRWLAELLATGGHDAGRRYMDGLSRRGVFFDEAIEISMGVAEAPVAYVPRRVIANAPVEPVPPQVGAQRATGHTLP